MHTVHSVIKVLYTLGGLGREELEGDSRLSRRLLLRELLSNMHLVVSNLH